eukprot:8047939-Heterocapsa_arctica.AAC.2
MCLTTPPGRVMPPGYAGMSDPPRELMSVVCGIPGHLTSGTQNYISAPVFLACHRLGLFALWG